MGNKILLLEALSFSVDGMFMDAKGFNQDLSGWDVVKVTGTRCWNFDFGAVDWVLSKPNFVNCSQ